ncbi:PadR family transcriptional regulator [Clostridium beijerinckii]|uniref:PadR family transcriptional regulator n=1 Tax=Clostridium beijerinckii TaxID=1520 RepID=UPI001494309D|nr:PadR family transcriptional regulator [Clostridium beijerinckii]NOW08037.1 PadR family transcriptional regulator PadR [Clostridium beijerinckii]NYC05687.1 PadR family transcriptional regulator PadR [Clostridium beijerinckii]
MEVSKEIVKGHLESIILSLLKKEEMYGYDISKKIRVISKETFEIKEGTLYVVLKRLENSRFVKSHWDDEESGGGRRRYHQITEDGLRYLENKEKEWNFFQGVMNKFFERCN